MSDDTKRSTLSTREMELIKTVRDSGVINFDQLGKLVAKVTPDLFDPGVAADDYIATGYSSVIKIWKMMTAPQLDQVEALRKINADLRG